MVVTTGVSTQPAANYSHWPAPSSTPTHNLSLRGSPMISAWSLAMETCMKVLGLLRHHAMAVGQSPCVRGFHFTFHAYIDWADASISACVLGILGSCLFITSSRHLAKKSAHPIVKTLWEKDLGEGKPFKEYNPSKGALLPVLMSSIAALGLPCLVRALTMS